MTGAASSSNHSPDGLWDPTAIPAATVIVVRDVSSGIETLMLRRDNKLSFAGGMWVFPGGRIDPEDFAAAGINPDEPLGSQEPERVEVAARTAAVREAFEETGLSLDVDSIRRWSHWTPPPEAPKRFSTAFYVAALSSVDYAVIVDDSEIREHRWLSPEDVISKHREGLIALTPPTYITLTQLLDFTSSRQVIASAEDHDFERFATRFVVEGDRMMALYHGDSGYPTGDADLPGARHRLTLGAEWRYERDA